MKKSVILFGLLTLLFLQALAQNVPNGGMEDWEINTSGALEPTYWESLNDEDFLNVIQVPGHSGSYAAQLSVEWDDNMGSYIGPMFFMDGNQPVSQHFTELKLFIKGTAVEGDYMQISIGMYREGELIGAAIHSVTETYNNWTEISIPIDYTSADTPDEAFIGILIPIMTSHYGTGYTIDDLSFEMGGGPTAPSLMLAVTNAEGTEFQLQFTTTMANPEGKHEQFSGTHGGNPVSFTNAALSQGQGEVILLTLSDPVLEDEVLRVNYTPGDVVSTEGIALEAFTNQPVINLVSGVEEPDLEAFAALLPYPNPAGRNLYIDLLILQKGQYCLQLFDAKGRVVMEIHRGMMNPGKYVLQATLDGLPNGEYICRLSGQNRGALSRVIAILK